MFNKNAIMGFDIVFFTNMMMTVSCDDSSKTCTSMLGVHGLNMLLTVVITTAFTKVTLAQKDELNSIIASRSGTPCHPMVIRR